MKNGNIVGSSGLMSKTVKVAGEAFDIINDLVNQIIAEGVISAELCTILNCCKRKGDVLEKRNFSGLKLIDHILKKAEKFIEN